MAEGPADELSRLQAELAEVRAQLASSRDRADALQRRLDRILGSRSYRVARRMAAGRRAVAGVLGVGSRRP